MPVPLAGVAIAGAIGVVGGRLVKKGIQQHNKMQEIERKMGKTRMSGGIKGTGGANVNADYK